MAPLPVENTARIVFDYSVQGKAHSLMVRGTGATDPEAVSADFSAMLTANNTCQTADCSWSNAVHYLVNETFSRELGFDTVTMDGGAAEVLAFMPRFVSFIGRSALGRRVRFYWYGSAGVPQAINDYRLQPEEVARWDALYEDFKVLFAANSLCAIDGTPVSWKGYMNVGYNGYWQRKLRG